MLYMKIMHNFRYYLKITNTQYQCKYPYCFRILTRLSDGKEICVYRGFYKTSVEAEKKGTAKLKVL